MNINRYVLAVFSPTGGTLKVARAICSGLDMEGCEIDLCAKPVSGKIEENTLLIAAMPVYEGRIREVALQRLRQLRGQNGPAIAVAVYGNREYEDALLELSDTLVESGFVVPAAGAFIAEHSIIRSIGAGRPDAEDLKRAKEFGSQALAKITARDSMQTVTVPGDPDYRNKKRGTGVPPITNDGCNSCGICAAECPVGAIPMDAPNTTTEACIGCMRCLSVCPQNAREIPGGIRQWLTEYLQEKASEAKQPDMFL